MSGLEERGKTARFLWADEVWLIHVYNLFGSSWSVVTRHGIGKKPCRNGLVKRKHESCLMISG